MGWLLINRAGIFRPLVEEAFNGISVSPPKKAPSFQLLSQEGERVSLAELDDRFVLLYFGYTFCPDVCPATLAQLANATGAMPAEERDRVQVAMITVDPERDTVETMADYMGHFDPAYLGLTGSEDEIASVAEAYGVFYEKQASESGTGYLMNHTATVFLIDGDGFLRLLYPFGTPGADIAADLRQLIGNT